VSDAPLDPEDVRRLIEVEKFAPAEVGEMLGCSASNVGRIMRTFGIETSPEAIERRRGEGYAARSATYAARREPKVAKLPKGVKPYQHNPVELEAGFAVPGSSSCQRCGWSSGPVSSTRAAAAAFRNHACHAAA
jgi:hypothetical protein